MKEEIIGLGHVTFIDNRAVAGRENRYKQVSVDAAATIKNWRKSLYSFEWLTASGDFKNLDELALHERDKRLNVEKILERGGAIERPVLGIGILDNVEIGAGRDVFLTLALHGYDRIEVHVPVTAIPELKQVIVS